MGTHKSYLNCKKYQFVLLIELYINLHIGIENHLRVNVKTETMSDG